MGKKQVLSFENMGPQFVTKTVTGPDGDEYELKVRILTEDEMDMVTRSVTMPVPPKKQRFISKQEGYKEEPDLEDVKYQDALHEASRERMYRLLAAGLDLGVPGTTVTEKAAELRKKGIPTWVLGKAVTIINEVAGFSGEDITKRAESFQS